MTCESSFSSTTDVASITFTVPGEPRGKQRPRTPPNGGRPYTPQQTVSYENWVKTCAVDHMSMAPPLQGPLSLTVRVVRTRPASWPKKRQAEIWDTRKPDYDNLAKICSDAMNGIVYADDAQIAVAAVFKMLGAEPCVEITVAELPQP